MEQPASTGAPSHDMTADLLFLVQAFIVIVLPWAVSRTLRLSGLVPLVVIQIIIGVALGPSLFGRLLPDTFHVLFNPAALVPLSGAASIAVLFFGFITGLHFDFETLRGRSSGFAVTAAASVVAPTAAGIAGGLWLAFRHPTNVGAEANPIEFAAAVGICLGVTALPVLGALLRELKLTNQRIGDFALGLAAVSDATLWILLGGLMAATGRSRSGWGLLLIVCLFPLYLVLMTQFVRPRLRRAIGSLIHDGTISEPALIVIGGCAICSAAITEAIGLHYVFGAFIAGAIVPRELRQPILDRLQGMTICVLMPFFFMLTGLRTLIEPTSPAFVEIFLVTMLLGAAGKIGGTAAAAMLTGETRSFAWRLGTLVQTKGLMEVIVLNILLDRGIISTTVFSGLTLMAVVSTALPAPLLRIGHWRAAARTASRDLVPSGPQPGLSDRSS